MKTVKLRYEGCTVEAEIVNPDRPSSEYRLVVLDPKGREIVREEAELGGYTNLEWRLIHLLAEPVRTEYRKRIRQHRAWQRRKAREYEALQARKGRAS